MGRACSTNGRKRSVYRLLVGKPEGKRPLRRQRRTWVDNIELDLGPPRPVTGIDLLSFRNVYYLDM
jgi:hypothetical protein